MIPVFILVAIVSTGLFIYVTHKHNHRAIERSNRLAEKQQQLLEMLTPKF